MALERLNLSGNKITDLLVIGLNECTQLKWLDLRHNQIANPIADIGMSSFSLWILCLTL